MMLPLTLGSGCSVSASPLSAEASRRKPGAPVSTSMFGMVVQVLVPPIQTVTLVVGMLKSELDGVGPGPTVSGTTLGPPAEKLWLPLEELLLLEELPFPLLLEPLPPPQAVKATTATSIAQRRHRSMRISRRIGDIIEWRYCRSATETPAGTRLGTYALP